MEIVVITGSRDWEDPKPIELALAGAEALIVGDARGADAIALSIAMRWDIIPIVLCADPKRAAWLARKFGISPIQASDWDTEPKKAGNIRNSAMVARAIVERDAGMHVRGYAFPLPHSTGTHDCAGKLRRASFHVEEYDAYAE